jgi:hypothetical protein
MHLIDGEEVVRIKIGINIYEDSKVKIPDELHDLQANFAPNQYLKRAKRVDDSKLYMYILIESSTC